MNSLPQGCNTNFRPARAGSAHHAWATRRALLQRSSGVGRCPAQGALPAAQGGAAGCLRQRRGRTGAAPQPMLFKCRRKQKTKTTGGRAQPEAPPVTKRAARPAPPPVDGTVAAGALACSPPGSQQNAGMQPPSVPTKCKAPLRPNNPALHSSTRAWRRTAVRRCRRRRLLPWRLLAGLCNLVAPHATKSVLVQYNSVAAKC